MLLDDIVPTWSDPAASESMEAPIALPSCLGRRHALQTSRRGIGSRERRAVARMPCRLHGAESGRVDSEPSPACPADLIGGRPSLACLADFMAWNRVARTPRRCKHVFADFTAWNGFAWTKHG